MIKIQFFLLISCLFLFVCTAKVNAKQSTYQALQTLKQQSLLLERDILLLDEKIKKPLSLYLTQRANEKFDLNILTVLLDGRLLSRHIYQKQEKTALKKGGAQLLFRGPLATGPHKLTVFYRSGKAYQGGNEFLLNKTESSSVIEITLKRGRLKEPFRQPEVAINLLDTSKNGINIVLYRHLEYLKDTTPEVNLISQIMKMSKLYGLGEFTHEAALFKAKLYLEKDLNLEARDVLKQILTEIGDTENAHDKASEALLNEVRFYLGKSYYYLGEPQKTIDLLSQVTLPVGKKIQAEMKHLYSLTLMSLGEYKETTRYLRETNKKRVGNWDLYSQLNLSTALIQNGNLDEGIDLINKINEAQLDNDEAKLLFDEANQSLGYLLLNQNKPDQAREYLEKVSLHGPFSNLALLGAGWASARLQQYNQAIIPWLELQKLDLRDIPVQESMLAVPYAFEKMKMYHKANHFYQKSVKVFETELRALVNNITALKQGVLFEDLKQLDVSSENNWLASVDQASHSISLRYIKQFINDNHFFKLLRNFREAKLLKINAKHKIKQIIAIKAYLLQIADSYNQNMPKKNQEIHHIQRVAAELMIKSNKVKLKTQKIINSIVANLKRRAWHLLVQRKTLLANYLVQSRVALAQNYDLLNP